MRLSGHEEQIRGLATSNKNIIFSSGDGRLVQCWDVEQNKVIHTFYGHVSSIYCSALSPTMNPSVRRVYAEFGIFGLKRLLMIKMVLNV